MRTSLYRHYDHDGRLLYVGISMCVLMRTVSHRRTSKWFDDVALIKIEKFATRAEALSAETLAILNEKPIYNIDQTPRRNSAPRACPAHLKDTTYGRKALGQRLGASSETVTRWAERWVGFPQPLPGVWPHRWLISDIDTWVKTRSADAGGAL